MSPWALKALMWILEIPACFQPGTTISQSVFPRPRAFNSRGKKLFQQSALQTSFEYRSQIISKGMWYLLSAQFGKPQGLVETGPEKEMRASKQDGQAQPVPFNYETHVYCPTLKFPIL